MRTTVLSAIATLTLVIVSAGASDVPSKSGSSYCLEGEQCVVWDQNYQAYASGYCDPWESCKCCSWNPGYWCGPSIYFDCNQE